MTDALINQIDLRTSLTDSLKKKHYYLTITICSQIGHVVHNSKINSQLNILDLIINTIKIHIKKFAMTFKMY